MHGNAMEWCRDWFESYELPVREGDGERIVSGGSGRVFRGGSFFDVARYARSACRGRARPGLGWGSLGFRPAKDLTPE